MIPATPGNLLSGYINHIEPNGRSEGLLQHEGEEFGYVLEGEVEIKVSGHPYKLGEGDSFHFRSEKDSLLSKRRKKEGSHSLA